jgi:ankyrin repeat protein
VEAGVADVEAMDAGGRQALHLAAHNGNVEMLRYLKAAGSWLDVPDKFGRTALHYAVQAGSAPAVGQLLSWRACDVNVRTTDGATPLHFAAVSGFVEVAELLIDAGADVNAVKVDEGGVESTALRVAVFNDKPEVVELLLKAGAEVEPSGAMLMEAAERGCRGAVKVLLEARDWPEDVKAAAMEQLEVGADL